MQLRGSPQGTPIHYFNHWQRSPSPVCTNHLSAASTITPNYLPHLSRPPLPTSPFRDAPTPPPQPYHCPLLSCLQMSKLYWWFRLWLLPRLPGVGIGQSTSELYATGEEKSHCNSLFFLFLMGHKAASLLFRNLCWLVLPADSSSLSLQRDFNPFKR